MFTIILWAITEWIEPTYCGEEGYNPRNKWFKLLYIPLLPLIVLSLFEMVILLLLHNLKACLRLKCWAALLLLTAFGFMGVAHAELINLSIIAKIESNNNPMAYNRQSGAIGLFQITPIVLKEYNWHTGSNLPLNALYKPKVARKVAKWYITHRIPKLIKNKGKVLNIRNTLICYNAGHVYLTKRRLPSETRNYIKKYNKLSKEHQKKTM